MQRAQQILVAAFAAASIACASKPAGIGVSSSDFDLAPLVGVWRGNYTNPQSGRTGTIAFTLRAGESFASGNVVMIPKPDSLLTPEERDRVDRIIRRRALAWSVCAVDHAQVDRLGLIKARHLATAGAVAGLKIPAEYLLVDAWDVPEAPLPQMAVVRGDRTCASIMAASIVAKVARDQTMIEYDRVYPGYGFAFHKGYATPEHRAAIRRLGPSPIHRTSWAPFREFAAN